MKYYHGSRDGNLTELTTNHTKDGHVYVTSSRLVALTYAVHSRPNLFSTDENGKECYWELKPHLFEIMTKGKSAYIYTLENKDYEPVPQSNKCGHQHCYRVQQNVKVISKEFVPDIYEELLKYAKSGELNIVRCEQMPMGRKNAMTKDVMEYVRKLDDKELKNPKYQWDLFME